MLIAASVNKHFSALVAKAGEHATHSFLHIASTVGQRLAAQVLSGCLINLLFCR
jgi:hypothetical protein